MNVARCYLFCDQAELEALNSAAESINKLENELQVCTGITEYDSQAVPNVQFL